MNPFDQQMVKMQLPPGAGDSISTRGFTVQADADHCVMLPKDVAKDMESHGLTPAAEKPAKK